MFPVLSKFIYTRTFRYKIQNYKLINELFVNIYSFQYWSTINFVREVKLN
jgi:hypothetical protein